MASKLRVSINSRSSVVSSTPPLNINQLLQRTRHLRLSLEYLDSESVLEQANPEVATRGHQVIVKVIVARMQGLGLPARLQGAQSEKASWPLLQKVAEIFASSDR